MTSCRPPGTPWSSGPARRFGFHRPHCPPDGFHRAALTAPRPLSVSPQIVEEIVSGIVEKIPKPIDIGEVMSKYPVLYEESMNTVLLQEVIR